MRQIDMMRYFGVMVFLLLFNPIVPSFCIAWQSSMENESFSLYSGLEKSWRWDDDRDFEMVIRGQNRYTRYLRNYGLWGNFYGYEGRLHPHSSVFSKMTNSGTGMQFGLDLPSGSMFSSSLYYSYSSPKYSDISSLGGLFDTSEFQSTSHHFGLRWTSYGDGLFMQFGLNGGFDDHDFKMSRDLVFDGNGWQLGGNSEFGLDIELGKWKLRPHLAFDYRWLHHSEIDNLYGTLFNSGTYNAFYSNLGVRSFCPLGPILEWQTRLSWLHNYLGSNDPIRVQRFGAVSGLTSPTQWYLDGNLGRDWLWFGTGLKLHFGNFFNFFVDYDLTFNKHEVTHCGSIMLLFCW